VSLKPQASSLKPPQASSLKPPQASSLKRLLCRPVTRGRRVALIVALSIAIGLAYPLLELALKCRHPDSEACVWARAYWHLSIWIEPPIVAVIAAIVLAVAIAVVRRASRGRGR
jgi:hypothetical protein